jgi:hypothetical protein
MGGCRRFRCHWRCCRNWPLGDDPLIATGSTMRGGASLPPRVGLRAASAAAPCGG